VALRAGATGATARDAYRARFSNEPFVTVLLKGTPDLRRIVGSNRACLALESRGNVLTVCLTLDNITKGGAGQALQCLNLMLGVEETAGLPRTGLGVSG
jgi:N-acetyl-gamma-glutamyl-phosphate reductase